jgi:phosphoglycerol transferase MdoB-like AlkP superfamily enzyme
MEKTCNFELFIMAKKIIFSLLRQLLFWIVFFDFIRLVFIVYHLRLILVEKIGFLEILGIFWYSFPLDLATSCYLLIIPFLLLVIQSVTNLRLLNTLNKIYTALMIFCYSLTGAAEMGIYSEWKTKLTYKVIKYLNHPTEIFNSSETWVFVLLVALLLLMFLTSFYAYSRYFYLEILPEKRNLLFSLLFFIILPPLLVVGMRGGIQQIPINQSQSYYSRKNILNLAAVNNFFNLYISIFENLPNFSRNPYIFMTHDEAHKIINELYQVPSDTTISILKNPKPNIVLLILESWSADLLEDLGGEAGITPQVKRLIQTGILFDQVYASGARSEQGMASIFSGFPAHPISSITVQPDKFVKLPSLPQRLQKEGYSTSFYFGGQLIYGNMKSYMMFNNFDKIMEGSDFPSSIPRGKLGIHDQYTLGYQLQELKNQKQPFFSALFTVSTHSPWDQPYPRPLQWGDNEHEYINSAYYTDHCLGEYMEKARNETWYKNTLFIIVADHSHNSYRNWHPASREYHKIPMIFYGDVIKDQYKGTRWHKLGNQHDIAATLLAQLGLKHSDFPWSKDLFNPYISDFAYYSTEDGLGWIRPDAYFSYDVTPNYFYFNQMNHAFQDSIVRQGKAYLQGVFENYMGN